MGTECPAIVNLPHLSSLWGVFLVIFNIPFEPLLFSYFHSTAYSCFRVVSQFDVWSLETVHIVLLKSCSPLLTSVSFTLLHTPWSWKLPPSFPTIRYCLYVFGTQWLKVKREAKYLWATGLWVVIPGTHLTCAMSRSVSAPVCFLLLCSCFLS